MWGELMNECSTPFGDGAMWTGDELASRSERRVCSTPFGDGAMWTRKRFFREYPFPVCSTPFGDGAMWTKIIGGLCRKEQRVLNAFWRRGDVD